MENNKTYLKQFPYLVGILVLGGIAIEVVRGQILSNPPYGASENEQKWLFLLYAFFPVLFTLCLGAATKKWVPAIIAAASFLALKAGQYFLIDSEPDFIKNHEALYFLSFQIIFMIPHLIFFLLLKPSASKMGWIFLVLVIWVFADNTMYGAIEGVAFFDDLFELGLHPSSRIFNPLLLVVGGTTQLIFLCELVNFTENKTRGWNWRLLNPGNEYNKLNATIIFWVLKTSFYASVLGSIGYFKTIEQVIRYSGSGSAVKWQYFLGLLFVLFFVLAIAWYFRKFLLEYFATYGHRSRVAYWALTLPIVGFIVWLFMLIESRRNETFGQREGFIRDFSAAKPDGIIAFYVIFAILRISFGINYHLLPGYFVTIITSFGMFAWLYSSITGYYVNLYLNIAVFAVVFILIIADTTGYRSSAFLLHPLALMGIGQLVMILPAFHFNSFNYVSYEEEAWKPGEDLFR